MCVFSNLSPGVLLTIKLCFEHRLYRSHRSTVGLNDNEKLPPPPCPTSSAMLEYQRPSNGIITMNLRVSIPVLDSRVDFQKDYSIVPDRPTGSDVWLTSTPFLTPPPDISPHSDRFYTRFFHPIALFVYLDMHIIFPFLI